MSPSAGKSPPSSTRSVDIKELPTDFAPDGVEKENQRPPIYNPEDYLLSLKKYGKRGSIANCQSLYEAPEKDQGSKLQMSRSKTLPAKKSVEKTSSVASTPSSPESHEMTLRQFGSITDLLTKLRADLRSAFLSFVQEFVASPVDGISLLLEALRALQLSQTASFDKPEAPVTNGFRNQQFQRRALLDELACLQCLSICCSRCPDAGTRLGTSPIGLLPLAVSATGAGIRARILALQLLTVACDKKTLSDGSHRTVSNGHAAVSDALSTLRLRCGEPVRFRLMIGMFNSGGGSGELQTFGLRFVNTFVESADSLQDKLYLQAELNQAGFDPKLMTKTVTATSHWFEKLHSEVRRWEVQRIDVEALQAIAINAEQLRSKMVMLERRVTTLQDEKNVLTTMERRLQERCAELQKEVRKLREAAAQEAATQKSPVALPRQGVKGKQINSEHEDEGISGSDTGQSISPEPYRSQKGGSVTSNKFSIVLTEDTKEETTIEDVIEELENIVSDAEKDMGAQEPPSIPYSSIEYSEHEIIPSNLLPAPPKKSKSLAQLFSSPSELDSSDYMIVDPPPKTPNFFSSSDEEKQRSFEEHCFEDSLPQPDLVSNSRIPRGRDNGTNRALLNVIMDAREKERRGRPHSLERDLSPPQQFGGVFFMTDMSGANRYKDAPISQAIEPRRVSKSLDKMGSNCGVSAMIDVVERREVPGLRARISAGNSTQNIPSPRTTYAASNNFKFKPGTLNYGLPITTRATSRTSSTNLGGSKITDLPSGLF